MSIGYVQCNGHVDPLYPSQWTQWTHSQDIKLWNPLLGNRILCTMDTVDTMDTIHNCVSTVHYVQWTLYS